MLQTKKIAAAVAVSALLLNSFASSAFAATSLQISGNGTGSDNAADVSRNNTTVVTQTNTAVVNNNVDVDADTGNNNASDNTGGDVNIETGDADVAVDVFNQVNSNEASVENCNCDGDTQVLISGNGSHSDSRVDLDQSNVVDVLQDNYADVYNNVDVDAKTGKNDADDNTGGDVSIETGDADVTVGLTTVANSNSAEVSGDGEGGMVSARILGNGTGSDNDIDLDLSNELILTQLNWADVANNVDVDADTGYNDTNDNTGGDVNIETGDANAEVTVDNLVNFNWANVDCGCVEDLLAKIDGNGSHSYSDITFAMDEFTDAFQDNFAYLDNNLDEIEVKTGKNDADDNTSRANGDPSISTGDADATVDVMNEANANKYGVGSVDLSDEVSVDLSFDLGDLLNWFMGQHS